MNGLLAVARLADDKRLATMSIFLIDCATMISMIRHWLVGGAIFIISCGNSDGTPQGSGSGSGGSPTATVGTTTTTMGAGGGGVGSTGASGSATTGATGSTGPSGTG